MATRLITGKVPYWCIQGQDRGSPEQSNAEPQRARYVRLARAQEQGRPAPLGGWEKRNEARNQRQTTDRIEVAALRANSCVVHVEVNVVHIKSAGIRVKLDG